MCVCACVRACVHACAELYTDWIYYFIMLPIIYMLWSIVSILVFCCSRNFVLL